MLLWISKTRNKNYNNREGENASRFLLLSFPTYLTPPYVPFGIRQFQYLGVIDKRNFLWKNQEEKDAVGHVKVYVSLVAVNKISNALNVGNRLRHDLLRP